MTLKIGVPSTFIESGELNAYTDQLRRTRVQGLIPNYNPEAVTRTTYPTVAQRRLSVSVPHARYLHVAVVMSMDSGASTGYCKVRIVRDSDGAYDDVHEFTATNTVIDQTAIQYCLIDLSTLTNCGDMRGESGAVRLFMKTTAGTLTLTSAVFTEGESATATDYFE